MAERNDSDGKSKGKNVVDLETARLKKKQEREAVAEEAREQKRKDREETAKFRAEQRAIRREEERADGKIPPEELQHHWVELITETSKSDFKWPEELPRFKHFMIDGVRFPCRVEPSDEVSILKDKTDLPRVINYICNLAKRRAPFCNLSVDKIQDIVEMWANSDLSPSLPQPVPILWRGQEGFCMKRLNWEWQDTPPETPAFDDILSRMSNKDFVLYFIGSVLSPDVLAPWQLWIKGSPRQGKSTFVDAVLKALGPVNTSSAGGSSYEAVERSLVGAIGKILTCYPDCRSRYFLTHEMVRAASGGDTIALKVLYQGAVSAKLRTKFLYHSNINPPMDGDPADVARCVVSTIQDRPDGDRHEDNDFKARLYAEAPAFLNRCALVFQDFQERLGGPPDRDDYDLVQEIINENNQEYHEIIEQYLDTSSASFECTRRELRELFNKHTSKSRSDNAYAVFKRVIAEYGVNPNARKPEVFGKKGERFVKGCKIKGATFTGSGWYG